MVTIVEDVGMVAMIVGYSTAFIIGNTAVFAK
jgi:hypothetical protein